MSEPWRYHCPDCGSVQLRRREEMDQVKEVYEDRRFATTNWSYNSFYCTGCQTALEKVYDAKVGESVYPGRVDKTSIPRWQRGRVQS